LNQGSASTTAVQPHVNAQSYEISENIQSTNHLKCLLVHFYTPMKTMYSHHSLTSFSKIFRHFIITHQTCNFKNFLITTEFLFTQNKIKISLSLKFLLKPSMAMLSQID